MDKIILKSPAKINLLLQIENKRTDGLHNLKTIMQTINLFDKIKIIKTKSIGIKCYCSDKNLPTNEKNLSVKAAIEFFKTIKMKPQVKIKIIKKIPSQAGLGGASSNAALTLIGLNEMFKSNLCQLTMLNISKKIGADVPFFFFRKTALVSGFGDVIKPLKPIKNCYFLLLKPKKINICTKKAFELYDLNSKLNTTKNKNETIEKVVQRINENKNINTYCANLFNDFETTIKTQTHEIMKIKQKLKRLGALNALMSGSGSCVFGIFDSLKKIKKIKHNFKRTEYFKFICKPI